MQRYLQLIFGREGRCGSAGLGRGAAIVCVLVPFMLELIIGRGEESHGLPLSYTSK